MADWISTINGLIALITGLAGLIGTGVGVFFAIKSKLKELKEKDKNEKLALLKQIADAAMSEAEHSDLTGPHKKEAVISIATAGCKAAGIDISVFAQQLSDYIETSIAWYNDMKDKNKK